jgi:diguanylate cyclase (GGDEF)-like protein
MAGYMATTMVASGSVNLCIGVFFSLLFWRIKRRKTSEPVFHYFLFGLLALVNSIFLFSFSLLLDRDIGLTLRDVANRTTIIASTLLISLLVHFYKTYYDRVRRLDIYLLYSAWAFFSLWFSVSNRFFLLKEPYGTSRYYVGLKYGIGLNIWAIYILLAASYSLFLIVDCNLKKWRRDGDAAGSGMLVILAHAIWLCCGFCDALTAVQVIDLPPLTWVGSFLVVGAISWMLVIEIDDIYRDKHRFHELTMRDPLTGVYSRHYYDLRLANLTEELGRNPTRGCFIICDVDGLKGLNDSLGHLQGDLALIRVAKAFNATIRATDWIARYGGDEFVIVTTRLTGKDDIPKLISRFETTLSNLCLNFEGSQVPITCCLGITYFAESHKDIPHLGERMFARADEALYQSKKRGNNSITFLEMPPHQPASSPS